MSEVVEDNRRIRRTEWREADFCSSCGGFLTTSDVAYSKACPHCGNLGEYIVPHRTRVYRVCTTGYLWWKKKWIEYNE